MWQRRSREVRRSTGRHLTHKCDTHATLRVASSNNSYPPLSRAMPRASLTRKTTPLFPSQAYFPSRARTLGRGRRAQLELRAFFPRVSTRSAAHFVYVRVCVRGAEFGKIWWRRVRGRSDGRRWSRAAAEGAPVAIRTLARK